jgi:hypothetical protein
LHPTPSSPEPPRELANRWMRSRWRNDAFVPGATHEDGLFLRFAGTGMLVARVWGSGGAWLLDARRGLRWLTVEPWLDLAGPNLTPPREEPPILPWLSRRAPESWAQLRLPYPDDAAAHAWNERAAALPEAIAAIPVWAAAQVERVEPCFQWRLLRWLERTGPPGAELCEGNLALAVLLAAEGERRGLDASQVVLWRRRRVAAALGLPGSESCVRLLGKLQYAGLRPSLVERVARWTHDPETLRRIGHVPRIGLAGWMLHDSGEFAWLDDGLLTRLLATDDEAALESLHRFTELARSFRRLGHPIPGPIHSVGRLAAEAEEMAMRFDQLRDLPGSRRLAGPPVPAARGFIEAMRSVRDVHEEALIMGHCVLDYVWDALEGRVALYRVLQPKRATLCLRRSPSGVWGIDELRQRNNYSPGAATRDAVETWLSQ